MYNQGDDRDDQEKVNQAPRDVECQPTKDPCDKKDYKDDQKQRVKHGDLLFSLFRFGPSMGAILLGRQGRGCLC
jgi:hypothetical protein